MRPTPTLEEVDSSRTLLGGPQSALSAMARGSVGFALVSLGGFAVWAFAGKWLTDRIGEPGMYAVSALVFLLLSGMFLNGLLRGTGRIWRFYKAFVPAFLAYAAIWSVAWFSLGFGRGEWIGALAGTTAFTVLTAWSLRSFRGFIMACLVLFATHSAGYFLGGELYYWTNKPEAAEMFDGFSKKQIALAGRMAWGLLYGLGFGAGLGYAFYRFQTSKH